MKPFPLEKQILLRRWLRVGCTAVTLSLTVPGLGRGMRSFSDPQCESLVGFLKGKLREVPSPRSLSLSNSSALSLQQFVNITC